ncbi:MAG TPA: 4-hydroxyphenylacetate 3-hydroxylase C-terminal domain-containing protein [Acidimicrobiales bacterium]|nr:4-hydroxyphenylacetate 3-hydroxylase C-terminal domain-containing protein [Acidimicrobiales bacterium]
MITGDEYRAGIGDGRAIWLSGRPVGDVTTHPLLSKSVDSVASGYDEHAGRVNPMYGVPRTHDELRAQMEVLLAADRTAPATAGCLALTTVADELAAVDRSLADALLAFAGSCRDRDVRVAAAVQDTASPVRVVGRRGDSLVLSGGKQHVVGAAEAHELLVVPSGPVGEAEPERAVACAVPLNAPGVRVIASTPAPRAEDDRHYPFSRVRSISDCLVVLDDVTVGPERVFLDGQVSHAGLLGSTLGVWERALAVADQADRAELIMGLAQTISDMNGISAVSHVRDKLSAIAVYAKMCRAGWESALANAKVTSGGMVSPDESYLYAAKAYGASLYSDMTAYLHDVAGGLVITCPTIADLDNPDTGDDLRKYIRTMEGVSGEDRMRIFHLIRDLTADTYGGWDKVTNQVIGGGLHAQRMATLDTFDLAPVKARARAVAGCQD